MQKETAEKLVALNQQFYQTFAGAFAATRRRIQPGVRRILNGLPTGGAWLDIGCGSGALAREWGAAQRSGLYCGVDFSAGLLAEARAGLESFPGLEIRFVQANLGAVDWSAGLEPRCWDGVLAFAVLHHLPGAENRLRLLKEVRSLLPAGGWFIHSEWQFQHSPRLVERILPWERAGLRTEELEAGDTLLDWRAALPGQEETVGLRYVHLFSREELADLAQQSGFAVVDEFESDGEGSRLGLYQRWRAV